MAKDVRNQIDELYQEKPEEKADKAIHTALVGQDISAEEEGKLRDLSVISGLPVEAIRGASPNQVAELQNRRNRAEQLRRSEAVTKWVTSDPTNAAISHDDIMQLAALEMSVKNMAKAPEPVGIFDRIGATAAAGPTGILQGLGGLSASIYGAKAFAFGNLQRLGEVTGFEGLEIRAANEVERSLDDARQGQQAVKQIISAEFDDWFQRSNLTVGGIGANDITSAAVSLLPSVTAAAVGGGPSTMAVVAGAQSLGSTYAEMRLSGVEHDKAAGLALLSGVITAALTRVMPGGTEKGIAALLKKMPEAQGKAAVANAFARTFGREALSEFAEEGLDEFLQGVLVRGEDFQTAMANGLRAGTIGGILGGGLNVAPGLYAAKRVKVSQAKKFAADNTALAAALDASKTAQRSKSTVVQFMQSIDPEMEGRKAYFTAEDLEPVLDNTDGRAALEAAGLTPQAIDEAARTGSPLELKLTDLHTQFPPAIRDQLISVMRQSPASISDAEAQQEPAETAEEAVAEAAEAQSFRQSLRQEEARLTKETVAAYKAQGNIITEDMARAMLRPQFIVARNLYARHQLSISDPAAFLRKMNIRAGGIEAEPLAEVDQQPADPNPEVEAFIAEQPPAIRDDLRRVAQRERSNQTEDRVGDEIAVLNQVKQAKQAIERQAAKAQKLKDTARGAFEVTDSGEFVISVFKNADLSTILHESAHAFLQEMALLVESNAAHPSVEQAFETIREWTGVDYFSAGKKGRAKVQEAFAVGFEEYLMEGKPPTSKLRRVFTRFSNWLSQLYKTGMSALPGRIELNDDVRQVFDNLLTLEGETELAFSDFTALTDAEASSLSGYGKKRLERLNNHLREAKAETLDQLLTDNAARINRLKKQWRAEATAQVEGLPVYQAADFIMANNKLSTAAVKGPMGEEVAKRLHDKGLIKRNGDLLPDQVAMAIGFPSGDNLLAALDEAPTKRQAIASIMEEKMSALRSDFTAVDAALTTDGLEKFLNKLITATGGMSGNPDPRARLDAANEIRRRVKAEAEMMLGRMPITESAKPGKFMSNVNRLVGEAKRALRDSNPALANAKFRQARLQMEAARLARRYEKQVETIERRAKRLIGSKAGTVDYDYFLSMLGVAHRYGFAPAMEAMQGWDQRKRPVQVLNRSADSDPDTFEPTMDVTADHPEWALYGELPPRDEGQAQPENYKQMTIDEVEDIDHMMSTLHRRGRILMDDKILDGKIRVQEAAASIVNQMNKLPNKKKWDELSWVRPFAETGDKYLAGLQNYDYLLSAMDGYTDIVGHDPGPAWRLLGEPLHMAQNEEFTLREKTMALIAPAIKHLNARGTEFGTKYLDINVPIPEIMRKEGRVGWTWERVLLAALNSGNQYNKEAVARGFGWTVEDDATGRVIGDVRMIDQLTGILTEEDWDAVQQIWDGIDTLYPQMAKVFERRKGFPLSKVEADSFVIGGKRYAGGYYPVIFDTALNDQAEQQSEEEALKTLEGRLFPTTAPRSGMTKGRVGTAGKPILLQFAGLTRHIEDTVKYITLTEPVADMFRITQDELFKDTFIQKFGKEHYRNFRVMFSQIAMPDQEQRGFWDKAADKLRTHATPWFLSYNFKTALTQITGLVPSISDAGFSPVAIGMRRTMANPRKAAEYVSDLSPFMKERLLTGAGREVKDSMKRLAKNQLGATSKLTNARDAVEQWGMSMILGADFLVSVPTWIGVYETETGKGVPQREAILRADKVVGRTQNASRKEHLAAVQRDPRGVVRLLTMFSSFTMRYGNRQRAFYGAWRSGAISSAQFFSRMAFEGIFAPMAALALYESLLGKFPPDEDDEDWHKRYAQEFVSFNLMGMPGFREAANYGMYGRKFGDQIPVFTGADLTFKAATAPFHLMSDLSSDEPIKVNRAVWALADCLSFWSKVPVSRVAERLYEGHRQATEWEKDLTGFEEAMHILMPDPDKRRKTR